MNLESTADDSKTFATNSSLLFFDPERAIPSPSRAAVDRQSFADDSSRAFIDSWPLFHDSKSTADDSSIARRQSILARQRLKIARSRFIFVFSRLPESSQASFAADSLDISNETRATTKEEDIVMSTPNKSIRRATIALDVPAKIADVILYANNIVQKMTNNPRPRRRSPRSPRRSPAGLGIGSRIAEVGRWRSERG